MAIHHLTAQQRCIAICDELREFDLHAFEELESIENLEQLRRRMTEFSQRTLRLIDQIIEQSPVDMDSSDDSAAFRIGVDRAYERHEAQERIEVIGTFAVHMLRQKEETLRGSTIGNDWLLILESAASLRRCILKTVVALEHALAELKQMVPQLHFHSEVQKGIQVRRLFAELRFELDEAFQQKVDVVEALRCAGLSIAKMMRLDAYEYFRYDDRRLLLDLKDRLKHWFEGGRDATIGAQLFDDIRFSLCLFMQINCREELMEHDRKTVALCIERIQEHQTKGFSEILRNLIGRSKRLDELIFTFTDTKTLYDVLLEIEQELVYATTSTFTGAKSRAT